MNLSRLHLTIAYGFLLISFVAGQTSRRRRHRTTTSRTDLAAAAGLGFAPDTANFESPAFGPPPNPRIQINTQIADNPRGNNVIATDINNRPIIAAPLQGSPTISLNPALQNAVVVSPVGSLAGLTNIIPGGPAVLPSLPASVAQGGMGGGGVSPSVFGAVPAATTLAPSTTTFAGYLPDKPYPFVLPPPDIPYFGSKWVGPWGYPIGHYQAFRGTGQYITHYDYYPLNYFGSLMAPFAYGISGKK